MCLLLLNIFNFNKFQKNFDRKFNLKNPGAYFTRFGMF